MVSTLTGTGGAVSDVFDLVLSIVDASVGESVNQLHIAFVPAASGSSAFTLGARVRFRVGLMGCFGNG